MYLGIEIGGTKLQLGIGAGDGVLAGLWRGEVDVAAGPEGIRRQIIAAVPELLAKSGIERSALQGVGIGFGGPVDDNTKTIIKSHQIDGWDDFPLADWIGDVVGLPAALGNDADVAGLAEALYGAGKGLSPIFYITIGSGIGGGLIIDGEIYRGVGRGAAEIGHLRLMDEEPIESDGGARGILEDFSSGWGMESAVETADRYGKGQQSSFMQRIREAGFPVRVRAQQIVEAAEQGDLFAASLLVRAIRVLAEAICHVITLLCPRRIVIGGGVSLIGEKLLFAPLRGYVAERVFKPFAGLTDIVPAALGEEVVVHGALVLARKRLGG